LLQISGAVRASAGLNCILYTPGMGLNLWGVSPLYVNPGNVGNRLTEVLAEGKGDREASTETCRRAHVESLSRTWRSEGSL